MSNHIYVDIERVKIKELPDSDIQALRKLVNKDNNSIMIGYLPNHQCPNLKICNSCYDDIHTSPIVVIVRHKKQIIGWSLVENDNWWSSSANIHVFVNPQYRRMGIGKLLVEAVTSFHKKKLTYCAPNTRASKFYKNFRQLA